MKMGFQIELLSISPSLNIQFNSHLFFTISFQSSFTKEYMYLQNNLE